MTTLTAGKMNVVKQVKAIFKKQFGIELTQKTDDFYYVSVSIHPFDVTHELGKSKSYHEASALFDSLEDNLSNIHS